MLITLAIHLYYSYLIYNVFLNKYFEDTKIFKYDVCHKFKINY